MKLIFILLSLASFTVFAQPLQEAVVRGKAVYDANCSTCHAANGQGAAAGVPTLDGSSTVKFDTAKQIKIILDGTTRGMPTWAGKLSNEQLADVVTFTKNQWTNQTAVIADPKLVGRLRSRGDGCVDQILSPLPRPAGVDRVYTVTSPAGKAAAWWCLLPARQGDLADKQYWRTQVYLMHNQDINVLTLTAALGRIAVATDSVQQALVEANAAAVAVAPGSQKEYEYRQLAYLGCEKLRVSPLPDGTTFDTPLAANFCGPAPIPPLVVTPVWITSATSSYNTANGALSSYAGSIARGLACNDSLTIRVGTSTYKNFAGASKPTIVAQCVRTGP